MTVTAVGGTAPSTSPPRPRLWAVRVAAKRLWMVLRLIGVIVVLAPLTVLGGIWFFGMCLWFIALPSLVVGLIAEAVWNAVVPANLELHGVLPVVVGIVLAGCWFASTVYSFWEDRLQMARDAADRVLAWRDQWRDVAVWPPPVEPPPTPAVLPPATTPWQTAAVEPTRRFPAPVRSTIVIVAHRAWRVDVEGGVPTLRAVSSGTPWPSAELEAKCGRGAGHRAPDPRCSCGLYALKRGVPLPSYARGGVLASGAVELSGRVLEATLGYRAEQARIVGPLSLSVGTLALGSPRGVDLLGAASAIAVRLELRYGVTVNVKGDDDGNW